MAFLSHYLRKGMDPDVLLQMPLLKRTFYYESMVLEKEDQVMLLQAMIGGVAGGQA